MNPYFFFCNFLLASPILPVSVQYTAYVVSVPTVLLRQEKKRNVCIGIGLFYSHVPVPPVLKLQVTVRFLFVYRKLAITKTNSLQVISRNFCLARVAWNNKVLEMLLLPSLIYDMVWVFHILQIHSTYIFILNTAKTVRAKLRKGKQITEEINLILLKIHFERKN